MGHQLHDTKHGKAAILDLLGLVLDFSRPLDLGPEGLWPPSEVASGGPLSLLPSDQLPVADGDDNLQPAEWWDSADGFDAVGDHIEGGTIKIDGSGKARHGLDDISSDGKHGDAAVLDLNGTAAVEHVDVAIGGETF